MADLEVVRALLLLMPVTLWMGLFLYGNYSERQHASALLSFIWQFQAGLILGNVAMFEKVPLENIIGQAALLGAVNVLLFGQMSTWLPLLFSAVGIYLFAPNTAVSWQWYSAEFALVCLPSVLLGVWTARETHIYVRTALQTVCWACLLLWLFPDAVFNQLNGGWDRFLERPLWMKAVSMLPMLLPGVLLLSSVYQFAVEGRGTGFPYDPPVKLVTGGVYAYISNPTQLGICLLMLFWGIALMSIYICASAIVALFLFVVFKDICNGSCAVGKTDVNWGRYQNEVPKWFPRLKPWQLNSVKH
jgi:protein-S-isoprenylcysteine O-methyltransferase Ste14